MYLRLVIVLGALLPAPALAQSSLALGGDWYASGQSVSISNPVERDAFAAGGDVTLTAPVTGNAHMAGFNVNQDAAVGGNLYAAGFSVNLNGSVGRDVTAAGNSVALQTSAPVAGNVRMAGSTVTISGPVNGSALVSARTLTLNSTVNGDFHFSGEDLNFGPGAKVNGNLTVRTPREIAVPATVASADRVHYQPLAAPPGAVDMNRMGETLLAGFWLAFWAIALWWLLLFIIGAIAIALMPHRLPRLEEAAGYHPWRRLGIGLLAFAAALGLVPAFAISIIGLVLVPIVAVIVVIALVLAYLAGVYLVGLRLSWAFLPIDTNLKRIGVLILSIIIAGLLGMIPIIGWWISLGLLIFGFGVLAYGWLGRRNGVDGTMEVAPPTATQAL